MLLVGLIVLAFLLQISGSIMAEEESSETVPVALTPIVSYQTHIENVGWEVEDAGQAWNQNGGMSGTSGKGLSLEGMKIKINNDTNLSVQYQTHIQNVGFQEGVGKKMER